MGDLNARTGRLNDYVPHNDENDSVTNLLCTDLFNTDLNCHDLLINRFNSDIVIRLSAMSFSLVTASGFRELIN